MRRIGSGKLLRSTALICFALLDRLTCLVAIMTLSLLPRCACKPMPGVMKTLGQGRILTSRLA